MAEAVIEFGQATFALDALISGAAAQQDIPAPRPLDPPQWPPNYGRVFAWRQQQLAKFARDKNMLDSARAWYAGEDLAAEGCTDPARWSARVSAFICHWCDTFDPRLIGTGRPARMPFVMFRRQAELVEFIMACMLADASGLVEKTRDMGATWTAAGVSVWGWTFQPGFVAGWGSNKADQVDVLGNPKSIFEKIRMLIEGTPDVFRPPVERGVDLKLHTCKNPATEAVIDGEIGTNIGRGGRSRVYFVDEAAHLEHPEQVEASLSENTRCRIDISSVSQPGTVFERKRSAGKEWEPGQPVVKDRANVFIMDWSHHPEKTPEWYAGRRAYYEAQGTPAVVAREIDRDYMAAADGIIIKHIWALAAVDADKKLAGTRFEIDDSGGRWGALDVADEGVDTNALIAGQGIVVDHAEEWGERDPGATARRAFRICRKWGKIVLQYDCIGLGTNVKSEFNRLTDDAVDVSWLTLVPWNAGAKVINPGERVIRGDASSPTNKNYFHNFKAQAWWNVGQMFYKTWRAIEIVEGRLEDDGTEYAPTELICIRSATIDKVVLAKLLKELSQATMGQSAQLKQVVNKAPDGAKSPNLGDGLVMGRYPAPRPRPAGGLSMFGPKIIYG